MINKILVSGLLFFAANVQAVSFDYPSVWECNTVKKNWYCDEDVLKKQRLEAVAKQESVNKNKFEEGNTQGVAPISSEAYKAEGNKPKEEVPRELKEVKAKPEKKVERLEDVETAEELRKLLKDKEDLAVMQPTEENLKEYLLVWQETQNKASVFADQWQRVVWKNPQLDYSIQHPTTSLGLNVKKAEVTEAKDTAMREIAKKHGLIFFFRSDCKYCQATAKVMKEMERKYGIDVVAASLDGAGLPEYPQYRDGRKLGEAWGVDVVPALFIANKNNAEHAPVGFGAMTLAEIVDRMYQLTYVEVGGGF